MEHTHTQGMNFLKLKTGETKLNFEISFILLKSKP
jgi:hypothetical protein